MAAAETAGWAALAVCRRSFVAAHSLRKGGGVFGILGIAGVVLVLARIQWLLQLLKLDLPSQKIYVKKYFLQNMDSLL